MREFLEFIAKHLVDKPEDVKITMEDRSDRVFLDYRLGKAMSERLSEGEGELQMLCVFC